MFLIKLLQTGKMNKENFTKYATDFSLLDEKSLDEIKAILDEFPHFQSAWILYAKNLHKLKDVRFENKLKLAATYVPDRRILKRLLNDTYKPLKKDIYSLKETLSPTMEEKPVEATIKTPILSPVEPEKEEIKIQSEIIPEAPKEEVIVSSEKIEAKTIEAKVEKPVVNYVEPEKTPETPIEEAITSNEKLVKKTVEPLSIADQILNNTNKIKQEESKKGRDQRAKNIEGRTNPAENIVVKKEGANYTENTAQKEEVETAKPKTVNKYLAPNFPPPYVFEKNAKPIEIIVDVETPKSETLNKKPAPIYPPPYIFENKEGPIEEKPLNEIEEIETKSNTKESTTILETPISEIIDKKLSPSFPPPYVFEKKEKIIEEKQIKKNPKVSTKEIKTKPTGSAADRIIKTINDIREGTNLETTSSPTIEDSSDNLQAIIAQRLAELGIKSDTLTTKPIEVSQKDKALVPEIPQLKNEDEDILDFEQLTGISPDKNSQKDIKKPEINSKDYINFDFGVTEKLEIELKLKENDDVIENIIEFNSEKKAQLIDKFLASNPRIKADKEYISNGSVSTSIGVSENEELFSETLAKIYIKQKHLDKAILTYEKLCLKYPEKNIYFASQIEKIKNLIKNKD